MVGVGGSIGTGILLGSGAAMQIAGPAAILSFAAAAFICFTVTMALGELASAHPAAGSFGVYGELYLNPFAGFLARAGYWIGMALNLGAEMVADGAASLASKRSTTTGLARNCLLTTVSGNRRR